MADPAHYTELRPTDPALTDKEASLQRVRLHYQAKGCKIYRANKPSAGPPKNVDFIIICGHAERPCIVFIEVKDGNWTCRSSHRKFQEAVNAAKDAGHIAAGANPNAHLVVFNGTLRTMGDQDALATQEVDVGTDKKKATLVTRVDQLPC
jgi:hypothetical protein